MVELAASFSPLGLVVVAIKKKRKRKKSLCERAVTQCEGTSRMGKKEEGEKTRTIDREKEMEPGREEKNATEER